MNRCSLAPFHPLTLNRAQRALQRQPSPPRAFTLQSSQRAADNEGKTKIITGAIASLGLACASSAYALNLGDPMSNASGIQLVREGGGPGGGGGGGGGGGRAAAVEAAVLQLALVAAAVDLVAEAAVGRRRS